jgi:hypothetical protein
MNQSQLKTLVKNIIKEVEGITQQDRPGVMGFVNVEESDIPGMSRERIAFMMMKDALGNILQKGDLIISKIDLIGRYLNRSGGKPYQREFEKIFTDANKFINSGQITSVGDFERYIDFRLRKLGGYSLGSIMAEATDWENPEGKQYTNIGEWAKDNLEKDGSYKGEPLHNYGFIYKVGESVPLTKYHLMNAMHLWNISKKKRNDNLKLGRPLGMGEMVDSTGRYKDDMESGVAVKRLHNLNEETLENMGNFLSDKGWVYVGDDMWKNPKDEKDYDIETAYRMVSWKSVVNELKDPFEPNRAANAIFSDVYKVEPLPDIPGSDKWFIVKSQHQETPKRLIKKDSSGRWWWLQMVDKRKVYHPIKLKEQSVSGGAGAYSTPFAFKKKRNESASSLGNRGENAAVDEKIAIAIIDSAERLFGLPAGSLNDFRTELLGLIETGKIKTIKDAGTWAMKKASEEMRGNVEEQTGTGAVAGYATPFAFSKKKSGSQRAIDATKKLGYKVVGPAPRV